MLKIVIVTFRRNFNHYVIRKLYKNVDDAKYA